MTNPQNNQNARQNNPQNTPTNKTGIESDKNKATDAKRDTDEKGQRNNDKGSKSS